MYVLFDFHQQIAKQVFKFPFIVMSAGVSEKGNWILGAIYASKTWILGAIYTSKTWILLCTSSIVKWIICIKQ